MEMLKDLAEQPPPFDLLTTSVTSLTLAVLDVNVPGFMHLALCDLSCSSLRQV